MSGCGGLMNLVKRSATAPFPGRSFFFLAIVNSGRLWCWSDVQNGRFFWILFWSVSKWLEAFRIWFEAFRNVLKRFKMSWSVSNSIWSVSKCLEAFRIRFEAFRNVLKPFEFDLKRFEMSWSLSNSIWSVLVAQTGFSNSRRRIPRFPRSKTDDGQTTSGGSSGQVAGERGQDG